MKPDWAHIYLSVLSVLPLHAARDESRVAAALRTAAAAITARHGAALRRAAVAQWEVRLRVPDKSGAWRVVVAAPTGHEAGEECVEVYREAVGPQGGLVYASKHVGGEVYQGCLGGAGGPVVAWLCGPACCFSCRERKPGRPCRFSAIPVSHPRVSLPTLFTHGSRGQVRALPRRHRAGALPAPGAAAAEAAGGAAPQDHLRL